jgi:hypothetical protein
MQLSATTDMDLKFLWIDKYKNIEKVGFNFSNSKRQHFSYTENKLIISDDQLSEPGPFFSENISSVNAIIGRNGSGKTNLSEFIHFHLCNFYEGAFSNWGLDPVTIIVVGNIISHHKSLAISNVAELELNGFRIFEYKKTPFDNQIESQNPVELGLDEATYIYYSNIFDYRSHPNQQNLIDISTNHLLLSATHYRRGFHMRYYDKEEPNTILKDRTYAFEETESTKIVEFVLETNYAYPFIKGELASINLDFSRLNTFLDYEEMNPVYSRDAIYQELKKIEFELLQNVERIPDKNNPDLSSNIPAAAVRTGFIQLYLTNLLKSVTYYINFTENTRFFTTDFVHQFIFDEKMFLAENELQQKVVDVKRKLLILADISRWNDRTIDLFDDSRGLKLLGYEKNYIAISWLHVNIDSQENFNAFRDLILTTNSVSLSTQFSNYYFGGTLSSGEKSMITLLSRLHKAGKDIRRRTTPVRHVKLFIDEGEVTMHPEWQREFFDKLVTFLNTEFFNVRMQLLMTSHSPFLLSDIPRNNIIFLDRDDLGKCRISTFSKEQTFGANIHTLYRDSFFMREGLIGEFALGKIKLLISALTSPGEEIISREKAKHLILIIGDDLIRERLADLFNKKYRIEENLNQRIERLRQELRDAENQRESI